MVDELMVDGACNLRDLGGKRTSDGRRVRRGRLIRSGELSGLAPSGAHRLSQMGLGCIVDFRSEDERSAAPTNAPELATVPRWLSPGQARLGDPLPTLRRCLHTAEQSREVLIELYREIAFQQVANYRLLFDAALTGLPVLFHCAAGKDRTGVGAALLLSVLNVPRDEIRRDYLLTNAFKAEITARFLALPGTEIALTVPAATWAPLMAVDSAYIDAMFEEVERRHGDVEGFVISVLGVTREQIQRLRETLLEDSVDGQADSVA